MKIVAVFAPRRESRKGWLTNTPISVNATPIDQTRTSNSLCANDMRHLERDVAAHYQRHRRDTSAQDAPARILQNNPESLQRRILRNCTTARHPDPCTETSRRIRHDK